jgi:hypothetical protein
VFDRQRWLLQVDVLAVQMLAEPLEARFYGGASRRSELGVGIASASPCSSR